MASNLLGRHQNFGTQHNVARLSQETLAGRLEDTPDKFYHPGDTLVLHSKCEYFTANCTLKT